MCMPEETAQSFYFYLGVSVLFPFDQHDNKLRLRLIEDWYMYKSLLLFKDITNACNLNIIFKFWAKIC